MWKRHSIIFLITAFWDIILRLMAEKKITFTGIEKMKWVTSLETYFSKHTVLAAALIAGFVGAITSIIVHFTISDTHPLLLLYITIISGLIGFPMKYSGLFPILNETYYKTLGPYYAFVTDAFSGFVVAITYAAMRRIFFSVNT